MNKIIWLTGPSGAGKTTVAKKIQERFACSILLDGDEMRESISLGLTLNEGDIKENNLRTARLAFVLAKQMHIIVAMIAPQLKTRMAIERAYNVEFIRVKRTIERDPERQIHLPYEISDEYPIVDGDLMTPEDQARMIVKYMERKIEDGSKQEAQITATQDTRGTCDY